MSDAVARGARRARRASICVGGRWGLREDRPRRPGKGPARGRATYFSSHAPYCVEVKHFRSRAHGVLAHRFSGRLDPWAFFRVCTRGAGYGSAHVRYQYFHTTRAVPSYPSVRKRPPSYVDFLASRRAFLAPSLLLHRTLERHGGDQAINSLILGLTCEARDLVPPASPSHRESAPHLDENSGRQNPVIGRARASQESELQALIVQVPDAGLIRKGPWRFSGGRDIDLQGRNSG